MTKSRRTNEWKRIELLSYYSAPSLQHVQKNVTLIISRQKGTEILCSWYICTDKNYRLSITENMLILMHIRSLLDWFRPFFNAQKYSYDSIFPLQQQHLATREIETIKMTQSKPKTMTIIVKFSCFKIIIFWENKILRKPK